VRGKFIVCVVLIGRGLLDRNLTGAFPEFADTLPEFTGALLEFTGALLEFTGTLLEFTRVGRHPYLPAPLIGPPLLLMLYVLDALLQERGTIIVPFGMFERVT
jgi:hypothetical protein